MSIDDRNNKFQIAIEERKIIQTIIESQETIRMKLVGWSISLVTALTIAFYSKKICLSNLSYFIFVIIIIIAFFIIDFINLKVFIIMTKRSFDVEKMIREDINTYDGPKIQEELNKGVSISKIKNYFRRKYFLYRFSSPYIALIIIAVVSCLARNWFG